MGLLKRAAGGYYVAPWHHGNAKSHLSIAGLLCALALLWVGAASAADSNSQASSPTVTSFTLVDGATGNPIRGFENLPPNAQIPKSVFSRGTFSVLANTALVGIRMVEFTFNGKKVYTDNSRPYALFGDDASDAAPAKVGDYVVTALPYDKETFLPGVLGVLKFQIVDSNIGAPAVVPPAPVVSSSTTVVPPVTTTVSKPVSTTVTTTVAKPVTTTSPQASSLSISSFTLVDGATGNPIRGYESLPANAEIPKSVFSRGTFSVLANTALVGIRMVEFTFNGKKVYTDNSRPYALFGDDSSNAALATVGDYVVTALPYDKETFLPGVLGVLKFKIVDSTGGAPVVVPPAQVVSSTTTVVPAVTTTVAKPVTTTVTTTVLPPSTPVTEAPKNSGSLSAFPGAVGFGSNTVAGSGRHLNPPKTSIYRVTNLKDSGAGSLRDCALATVPRTCVFDVSGAILLSTVIKIRAPYLTIAGQTAPSPGILVRGAGIEISTHDVLIQHLQVRPGDAASGPSPGSRDGINVIGSPNPSYNVVLDHLSVSWAVDENFSTWYPNTYDVSVTNSIISEALYNSIHPKGAHSMGFLVGDHSKRISIHGNLFAFNAWRNPRLKPNTSVEFVNNVVYGWGGSSGYAALDISDTEKTGSELLLRFEGNYFKPASYSYIGPVISGKPVSSNSRIYVAGNIGPSRPSNSGDEWKITALSTSPFRVLSSPLLSPGLSGTAPDRTLDAVVSYAGSRPTDSNSVDNRVVNEVLMGKGSLKDCVSGCSRHAGGWPVLAANTVKYSVPSDPMGDDNGDGYTNLENALHQSAAKVASK